MGERRLCSTVPLGTRRVGPGEPAYIIAEIGINHNGDVCLAKKLIEEAAAAGCDAVKFQKRTPEICVPKEQQSVMRDTPWGRMTYLEYKKKIELGEEDYSSIDEHCKKLGIQWFSSCWDELSVNFMEKFDPPCYKIASACLTDIPLLQKMIDTGRPCILSTGMSTIDEIERAVNLFPRGQLILAHSTSTYPLDPEEANLEMIRTLQKKFTLPVGYSGHESGLQISTAAIALGAVLLERHVTVSRDLWGTDHKASLEPSELRQLVQDVRLVEKALGDGVKRVYPSEKPIMQKLRRVINPENGP